MLAASKSNQQQHAKVISTSLQSYQSLHNVSNGFQKLSAAACKTYELDANVISKNNISRQSLLTQKSYQNSITGKWADKRTDKAKGCGVKQELQVSVEGGKIASQPKGWEENAGTGKHSGPARSPYNLAWASGFTATDDAVVGFNSLALLLLVPKENLQTRQLHRHLK